MSKNVDRVIHLQKQIASQMAELERLKSLADGEGREPTAEERKLTLDILQAVEGLHAQLELEKREIDLRDKLNATARDPQRPELQRDSAQEKYPGLPPREMRFSSFGEQLMAIVRASQGSGILDQRLSYLMRAPTGMNEANPSDGGFLVQTDFSTELLQRAYTGSPVVDRVTRIPVSGNGLKMNAFNETSRVSSILGGIIPYWVGEGYDKTDTMPQFRQIELSLKKLCALWYATDELLADAMALSGIAQAGFAQALDVELERTIIRGTGAGQPLGILASPCLISVTRAQAGNTISATDVIAMWARLYAGGMPNAVWLASKSITPQLFAMELNDNLLYIPPSTGLRETPGGTLFGCPVLFVENCSALGTVGDLILASLSDYLLITKGGPQFASSIHVKFVSDQSTFRMVYRCDGQPTWSSALTPKDNSNSVGPFVALASV